MTEIRYAGDALWDRIERAVEKVKDRLRRVVAALEGAGIPYAVAGGNAVPMWVAQVDESAMRHTQDVDIVLRRDDLEAAKRALETAGLLDLNTLPLRTFAERNRGSVHDVVHIIVAGEKLRGDDLEAVPHVEDSIESGSVRAISLTGLTAMKLTAHRAIDRTHLQDMASVGLIDETWLDRVPATLRDRLQRILDDPEG